MNTRTTLLTAGVVCVLGALLLLGLRNHRALERGLPPRIACESQIAAKIAAGPNAIAILGTGSMAPFISPAPAGSNPLETVVAYAAPAPGGTYEQIKTGSLVVYAAEWSPQFSVIHQAAQRENDGWVMTGLNNKGYENRYRVTAANFRALVSTIYVW